MERFALRWFPRIGDLAAEDRSGNRKPAAECFADAENVGTDAFAVARKVRTGPSEARVDLIEDENRIAFRADPAQAAQEAFGR